MSAIRTWCIIISSLPRSSFQLTIRHRHPPRSSKRGYHVLRGGESTLNSTPPVRSLQPSMADNGSISSTIEPDCTEIIVIRHGETEWNADRRIQGHLDVELNNTGRQQAVLVAERLAKGPKISVIYSSDLKRAYFTAETIANCCGGIEVIKDPALRERNLGDLQGHVYHELSNTAPVAYLAFVSNRTDQEIPGGGESLDQFYDRCTSALQSLAQKHRGQRVVVVSHGGVIRSLYKRASPNGRPGKILNTSVNILHLSDGEKWVVKSWGDVSHLNETGFLESAFGGDKHSVLNPEAKKVWTGLKSEVARELRRDNCLELISAVLLGSINQDWAASLSCHMIVYAFIIKKSRP